MFAIVDLNAAVVISAFVGRLAQRFDKTRLAVVLFAGAIVIGPILLALRLLDIHYGLHLLPPNRPKYGPPRDAGSCRRRNRRRRRRDQLTDSPRPSTIAASCIVQH